MNLCSKQARLNYPLSLRNSRRFVFSSSNFTMTHLALVRWKKNNFLDMMDMIEKRSDRQHLESMFVNAMLHNRPLTDPIKSQV